MTSFDYRLNPIYTIKECSTCGALYTADFCCLKKGLEDKILVPLPTLSPTTLKIEKICLDCGDPIHGLMSKCALLRKTLEEVFQDFQDTSKSSMQAILPSIYPTLNAQNELLNSQNEFLNSSNKLMEQMTTICDLVGQAIQKKEEEKRIAEEQAGKYRYWKIPICY
ncbi:hypothetical protein Tco_0273091 [Tanacetum coccineum]